MTELACKLVEDSARTGSRSAPASYAQERVWFASQFVGARPVYHVVDNVEISHPVSADEVLSALAVCCQRHEALRTSFILSAGELMQVVHADVMPKVDVLDLTDLARPERAERIDELLAELAGPPLPLDQAPLWRATLMRLEPPGWVTAGWMLLFAAHHAVFDAASALNLRAELTELCAAVAQGRKPSLPELPVQCADHATWQRDWLAAGRMDELLAYWRTVLDGAPAVHRIETDLPRPAERGFSGADLIFPLPPGAESTAASLARQVGATPFMVMFAAYVGLLHRLSEYGDIVIGLPVTGRDRPELQPLIGTFVNMLVIRVAVGSDLPFTALLDRTRRALLEAWDHQELPFQKLVEVFADRGDASVPPLYQLGFNYLSIGSSRPSAATEDDLMLEIAPGHGRIEYNTALFTEPTASWLADCYVATLTAVLAAPQAPISDLALPPRPATPVHARLSAATGVGLPIQSFFANTTIPGIAAELTAISADAAAADSEAV